ncbi:MAG: MBL fold metallo-hydrolase [Candidatus Micrarchaeota archaeon]|nr:MBL fold metallo-hydrolase [Candidatus Micrarchaeota archaeon]
MNVRESIFWIGHAAFYIKAKGTTIFIDPFKVGDGIKEKADIMLITHPHFDHNSKADIDRVRKDSTRIIAPKNCLDGKEYRHLEVSMPGFRTKINDVEIEAVSAYNKSEERQKFHPKSENWVGYVISIDGTRIYHAGDTDLIPEMENIRDIDVALLPMGGTYTMAEEDAINAAKKIGPKTVIPMHYKMVLGRERSDQLEKSVTGKLKNALILKEVQEPMYSF